jgi:tetratricopeptide (TPR) repeat protein
MTVASRPLHPDPAVSEALALAARGRKGEALGRLRPLLAAAPADPELNFLVGTLAAELGDAAAARPRLEAAVAARPDHLRAALTLDALCRQAGDHAARIALWRRHVAAAPGELRGGLELVTALLSAGDRAGADEARGRLPPAPDGTPVALALAQIYHAAGHEDAAVGLYREHLQSCPGDDEARRNLAAALQVVGETGEARGIYEALLARRPQDHRTLTNLATLLKDQDDLPAALRHYRRAMLARRRRLTPGEVLAAGRNPAARTTTLHSLRLEREQLEHLAAVGIGVEGAERLIAGYDDLIAELEEAGVGGRRVTLTETQYARVGEVMQRLVHLEDAPALPGGVLDPARDWAAIEEEFLGRPPGIVVVDGFLRPEALDALRRYCHRSTVWFGYGKVLGYCGAYMQDGFGNPLLLQLADELRTRLPRVVGPHLLNQMWGYIYDQRMSGITAHADPAAVNLNFWIVPDAANLDPDCGGLVVSKREAPADWDFDAYNNRPDVLDAYMARSEQVRVPYRCNRMVMFNSNLVHKTDAFHFRPGFTSRRINITMLFGHRRGAQPPAA